MEYEKVDLENWPRGEHFAHYMERVPCTYSLTTKLDITAVVQGGRKLYPTLLYCLAGAVNRHEAFRMALGPDGTLVRYRQMWPSYTIFHRESETFSNLWTEYTEDYGEFCRRYAQDVQDYGDSPAFMAKPDQPENCFPVSMLPWHSFDGFNLNLNDYGYLIPIFTLGRVQEQAGRSVIPLAVQVHHAVCDGYHLCRFLDTLQQLVDRFDVEP